MEINLSFNNTQKITVSCGDEFSHTFDLENLLPDENNPTAPPQPLEDPVKFGQAAYMALFPAGSPAARRLTENPVSILLITKDPLLDGIPWEFMHDGEDFLALRYPFLRGLPKENRQPDQPLTQTLHVVSVHSSPLDESVEPLYSEGEWLRLVEIFQALEHEAVLERCRPATLDRITHLLAGKRQSVVHFTGHGEQSPKGAALMFEDERGGLDPVLAKDLLLSVKESAHLVLLSACVSASPGPTQFSNLAMYLVQNGIPYALGMRFSVLDIDALLFSRRLYEQLSSGVCIEQAVFQARRALVRNNPRTWVVGVPVLYSSLSESSGGFAHPTGKPQVLAHQPPVDIDILPKVEGIFQGRLQEQKEIGRWLTGDPRARLVTIRGEGGQGKTALARVAVERFAWAWPGGVCAISLESLPDLPGVLLRLAEFLGLPDIQTLTPAQLERLALHKLALQRTLLLLDNAETLIEAVEAQRAPALELAALLRERLPATTSLLVTSRRPLGWPGEVAIELGGLSPQEGARLFVQCASNRLGEMTMEEAEALSARLGGHALSLHILGATFNELNLSLASFTQQVEQHLEGAVDKYRELDHRQRSLFASIDTSVVYLSIEQIEVLSALWLFQAPFQAESAAAVLDPGNADSPIPERLRALWQRGLLGRAEHTLADGELVLYSLLPVLRVYIKKALPQRFEEGVLLQRFGTACATLVGRIYEQIHESAGLVFLARAAEADLNAGLEHSIKEERGWYCLHWGFVLHRLGNPWKGQRLLEQALEAAQGGQDQGLELRALLSLGILCGDTGRPQRALDYYQQALQIMREVGDRKWEAVILANIGMIFRITGRQKEALKNYQQTLPIIRELGDRIGEAALLNNIGLVYLNTGQPKKALRCFKRALPILREVGNLSGEAMALNNMGMVNRAIGQPQEALDYFQQSLPMHRKVGNRRGEALALNNIGLVFWETGEPRKALENYQQALLIRSEVRDRAGEASTLTNIGLVYRGTGQAQKALEYYQQALPIRHEVGDRQGEATTLFNIACVYLDQQQPGKAVPLLERGIAINQQIGAAHSEAGDLFLLAKVLHELLGRSADAVSLLERSMRLMHDQRIERDDAGRTLAQHEQYLAELKGDAPPRSQASIPDDLLHTLQANTIAVLTSRPDKREEWRVQVTSLLEQAVARNLPQDQTFFQAILSLLAGEPAEVPDENPYAAVFFAIQSGVRTLSAGQGPTTEAQALEDFIHHCVQGLRGGGPAKQELFNYLRGLPKEDQEFNQLVNTIQLALLGDAISTLDSFVPEKWKAVWKAIVEQIANP